MTFLDRYNQSEYWYEKPILMEIYHLSMSHRHQDWTIYSTARDFEVSVGLVSENLKIARAIHTRPEIMDCRSRNEALIKLGE